MHIVPEGFRPKHQILILKCYPKFQKSKVEVKPNSSELSYLLYYTSTRRSKLPKVGEFLVEKNAHDIHRSRIGNVQVTVQILKALIEKCARELPLFACSVLRILATILRARDITLVEDSVPLFETFCAHRDSASLSADESYIRLYDEVAKGYIAFASKETPINTKSPVSIPVSIRFRSVGLQAIKAMVSSESVLLESHHQVRAMIPVILQNLYSEKHNYLSIIARREVAQEKFEKDQTLRRRQSMSQGHTNDTSETDPSTAGDTTADLDERADEEVGVLALQSLRLIFTANNRGQLRSSTQAILSFVTAHNKSQNSTESTGNWYTELFETISKWSPVQDRFIILVVVMETLVRSPILERDLPRQLIMARIAGWLFQSSIIFVGLSVMDVLIGLIQHTLLLLQLGGDGARLFPHEQQSLSLGNMNSSMAESHKRSISNDPKNAVVMEVVSKASTTRKAMLSQLEKCIGDLANHVYYSDQIRDMVSALLARLTPVSVVGAVSTASAIENPTQARNAIADSVNLNEKSGADEFFTFDTARLVALRAVNRILTVANARRSDGRTAAVRNRVGFSVWDGTQWLLRDPSGNVRKAYAEALLTWLHIEMDKVGARVIESQLKPLTYARKEPEQLINGSEVGKRAASSASQRTMGKKLSKSPFLQLIHLAIYDNAMQYAESEPDMLLLHLISTSLVQELGINSVRFGLPMFFRLQEDYSSVKSFSGQIAIGSLILGYFWTVTEYFDLEDSFLGKELEKEYSRRSGNKLWLKGIRVPPVALDKVGIPENLENLTEKSEPSIATGVLQPFTLRKAFVDSIAESYSEMPLSPPSSPPLSPTRRFSISQVNTVKTPPVTPFLQRPLPTRVKEQMLTEWSKENCIVAAEKANTKATSLGGSKPGTASKNFLAVDGNQGGMRTPSPRRDDSSQMSRPPSAVFGLLGSGRNAMQEVFRQRSRGSSPVRMSNSSSQSVIRVKEMKKALLGNYDPHSALRMDHADTESDSLVSANMSVSDIYPTRVSTANGTELGRPESQPRPHSSGSSRSPPLRPSTDQADFDIPPVPPLPPALHTASEIPFSEDVQRTLGQAKVDDLHPTSTQNERKQEPINFEENFHSWQNSSRNQRNIDELLSSIDSNNSRPTTSIGRPPY